MIGCEELFEILTQPAPPPGEMRETSIRRAEYQRHLAICPACRELAHAVGRAVELLQAVATDADVWELNPRWRAPGVSPWVDPAQDSTPPTNVEGSPGPSSQAARRQRGLALAGYALVVAASLLLLVASLFESPRAETDSLAPPPATLAVRDREALMTLRLASACFVTPGEEPVAKVLLAQADYDALACCTECHGSGGVQSPAHAAVAVRSSCAACHE